jgi:hypothetical protein
MADGWTLAWGSRIGIKGNAAHTRTKQRVANTEVRGILRRAGAAVAWPYEPVAMIDASAVPRRSRR